MKEWSVHSAAGILGARSRAGESILEIRKLTRTEKTAIIITPDTEGGQCLSNLVTEAVARNERIWGDMGRLFEERIDRISAILEAGEREKLLKTVKKDFGDIEDILKAVWLIGEASDSAKIYIDKVELLWILEAVRIRLAAEGFNAAVIDSSQLVHTTRTDSGYRLRMDKTGYHLNSFMKKHEDIDTLLIGGGWALCDDDAVVDPDEHSGELTAAAIGSIIDAEEITFCRAQADPPSRAPK